MFVCEDCSGFAADLLGRVLIFIPSCTHRAWIVSSSPSLQFTYCLPLTNLGEPHSSACVLSLQQQQQLLMMS